jgi:hypothetical protein
MAVMTSLALDPTAGSPGRRVLFVNRMDVYRLPASKVVQQLTRLDRDPFTGPGVPQRDPQWCQDQVGDLGGGGMPAHDPLGEHVDDEGDVDEPAQVLQWVKSATERMLGASAVKSRSNRSLPGGRLWPGRSCARLCRGAPPSCHAQVARTIQVRRAQASRPASSPEAFGWGAASASSSSSPNCTASRPGASVRLSSPSARL